MSRSAALSVSRVRYSVRNSWSTEMPCRYSRVAASGSPSVTVTNPDRLAQDSTLANHVQRRNRTSTTDTATPTSAATCSTVVTAWVTFDELNAGQCTRPKATRPTAATTTATSAANSISTRVDAARRSGATPCGAPLTEGSSVTAATVAAAATSVSAATA